MKTEQESIEIMRMCAALELVARYSGIDCSLEYDNDKEIIRGYFNGKAITINVHMDSVSAAFRDVIKGLADC